MLRKEGHFCSVSWQNGKQGIVELYGEGSTEIKEFPKIFIIWMIYGDTKDKIIFAMIIVANLHSFRKYSYSIIVKINNVLITDALIFVLITFILTLEFRRIW